jgi:hypothetical protein
MPSIRGADQKEAYARQFPVHFGVYTGKSFHKLVARGPDGQRRKAIRVDVSRAASAVCAVCAVARKLVPMLLRVMQTAEPFDLGRWRANRMRGPQQAA